MFASEIVRGRLVNMKRESNQNLSGDEVDYTNHLLLRVKKMLCGKPRCQKVLI